jgi:hypothetical protein
MVVRALALGLAFAAMLISSSAISHVALADDAPIALGSRRELFVDRALIESQRGVELKMHAPRNAGVTLKFDKPWEGAYCGYFTIIQDGPLYRMYYRGLPVLADTTEAECTCYAESTDGITWTKPELGQFELNKSRANNVVLHGSAPASHNFSPFLDERPGVPTAERYKAVGGSDKGLMAFKSADGLRWTRWRDQPIITGGAFDSQNVVFWSATENCFVCYFRKWRGAGTGGVRLICRTTSPDLLEWSPAEEMTYGDAPFEQFYTNQTLPYFRAPHIYVALPMRFFPNRVVLDDATFNALPIDPAYRASARHETSDGVFMTSRGGTRYDRTFLEAFMRPGLDPANWVSRSIMAAQGIVQTGPAEMSVYYQQHDGQPTAHLLRATLRLDGFASAHAGYAEGELVTKCITFQGDALEVNYSTGAGGSVRVEILDETGKPLPGFALADATDVAEDRIDGLMSWQGKPDVTKLASRPVRLRFVLRDADLNSFRFRPAREAAGR